MIFFGGAAGAAAPPVAGGPLGDGPLEVADGTLMLGDGAPTLGDAIRAGAGCDGAEPGSGLRSPPDDGKGFLAEPSPEGRGFLGLEIAVVGPRGVDSGTGRGAGDPSAVGDDEVRLVVVAPGSGRLAGVATMVDSAATLAAFSALMAR